MNVTTREVCLGIAESFDRIAEALLHVADGGGDRESILAALDILRNEANEWRNTADAPYESQP